MKYLFTTFLLFCVLYGNAQFRVNLGNEAPLRKLQMAEMAITNLYVDSVDESRLVEDAIRGMLEKLDPHSSYTTAKETKAMNEPSTSDFDESQLANASAMLLPSWMPPV